MMPYNPEVVGAEAMRHLYGQGYRAFTEGASASEMPEGFVVERAFWVAGFMDAMCEMSVLAQPRDVHPDLRLSADAQVGADTNAIGTFNEMSPPPDTEAAETIRWQTAEIGRLREALRLCERAASGEPTVIRKHCSLRDASVDLSSGTPLGIRVNTVGCIVHEALERPQEPVQQVAPQPERALDIGED